MDLKELLVRANDAIGASRAFGPAYEKDGCLVIPVAWVAGGGGGGSGEGRRPQPSDAAESGEPGSIPDERRIGSGGGFGTVAWPLGVYVVKDGRVRWMPAIDVTHVLVAGVALLRALVKGRARSKELPIAGRG